MNEKEFIDTIRSIFDDIDTNDFKMSTNFKENDEWSSLTALSLITIIDAEFGKTLTGKALENLNSIRELYEFLR